MKYFILCSGIFFFVKAQTPPALFISLKNNSEKEIEARAQLVRIFKDYKAVVTKCIFTDTVIIDEKTHPPHSHPTLTLNTRYLNNDTIQLSNFVHEQFHWMVKAKSDQEDKAIEAFAALFPDAPAGPPTGARDKYSTYLHLVVCDLEFQALKRAIGEPAARRLLSAQTYYTWVYDKVLNDKRIQQTNQEHGLLVPK